MPWQPDALKGILDELLQAAEDNRVASYAARCEEAGLMPKLCKEIADDAHFPKAAKVLLQQSLPRLAAKWLNKSGISAEFQDEVSVVTALLLIVQHERKVNERFDKLIELRTAELERQKQSAGRTGGPAGPYTAAPGGSTPPPATKKAA